MPSSDFVGMMSSTGFLGDPLIHTQHFIGATKWRKLAPDHIEGVHQIRAAHQRYKPTVEAKEDAAVANGGDGDVKITDIGAAPVHSSLKREVEAKGHGHAVITLTYRLIEKDGFKAWKWGGITTDIRWNEFDFDKIFKGFESPA